MWYFGTPERESPAVQRNVTPQFAKITPTNAHSPIHFQTLVFDYVTHGGGGGLGDRVGDVVSSGIACGEGDGVGPNTFEGFTLTNNILPAGATQIGLPPGSYRRFTGGAANTYDENTILSTCFPSAVIEHNAVLHWDGHALTAFPTTKAVATSALVGNSRTSTTPGHYAWSAAALAQVASSPGADVMRVLALAAAVDAPGSADGD